MQFPTIRYTILLPTSSDQKLLAAAKVVQFLRWQFGDGGTCYGPRDRSIWGWWKEKTGIRDLDSHWKLELNRSNSDPTTEPQAIENDLDVIAKAFRTMYCEPISEKEIYISLTNLEYRPRPGI